MNKEIRNLLIVVGLSGLILFLAKPRKSKTKTKGFSVPKTAEESENTFANAVTSIKAYRAAVKNNETKSSLDELNRELLKEYGIRIIDKGGLFTATDRSGKEIANEKV